MTIRARAGSSAANAGGHALQVANKRDVAAVWNGARRRGKFTLWCLTQS